MRNAGGHPGIARAFAAALALAAADAAAQDAGAKAFAAHCAACHKAPALAQKAGAGSPEAAPRLIAFLKRHGAADEAEDAAIVDYLQRVANGG